MFREINIKDMSFNPFTLIEDRWMLVTAGTQETGYNTLTAAWGSFGDCWHSEDRSEYHTTTLLIRPQRYTKEFLDRENLYTLSFFPPEYRDKLAYLGTHSGRDENKIAAVGLTPVFDDGSTYFEEADLVIICRKLYRDVLKEENFCDKSIVERTYPKNDYSYIYIGEVLKVLEK